MEEVGVRRGRGNGLMKLKINKYHDKAKKMHLRKAKRINLRSLLSDF